MNENTPKSLALEWIFIIHLVLDIVAGSVAYNIWDHVKEKDAVNRQLTDSLHKEQEEHARDIEEMRVQRDKRLAEDREAADKRLEIEIANVRNEYATQIAERNAEIDQLKLATNQFCVSLMENSSQPSWILMTNTLNNMIGLTWHPTEIIERLKRIDRGIPSRSVELGDIDTIESTVIGLASLRTEYEKPFESFGNVYEGIVQRLQVAPAMPPGKKPNLFKYLIMGDAKYEENLKSYYKYVGQTNALEQVRSELSAAYKIAYSDLQNIQNTQDLLIAKLSTIRKEQSFQPEELHQMMEMLIETLEHHNTFLTFGNKQSSTNDTPTISFNEIN